MNFWVQLQPLPIDCFVACLTGVETWLRAIRLRLNQTKTQVMWLGSSQAGHHTGARSVVVRSSSGYSS